MSCFSHQGVGWGGGEGGGSGILPTVVGYGTREPRKKKTPNNRGEGLPKFAQEKH